MDGHDRVRSAIVAGFVGLLAFVIANVVWPASVPLVPGGAILILSFGLYGFAFPSKRAPS